MLKNDIFTKLLHHNEGEFSVEELFSPQEWSAYSVQERRGAGRWTFNQINSGLLNKDGWVIEPLPNSNPQRYKKRRENIAGKRMFLNEISGIEQTIFKDWIKILDASGKWLEIVDKP
jgi:hypothetical protein